MTLIGKIDEYVTQLENAVNQLRQENQKLQEALQKKPASFRDEVDDEC